MKRSKSDEISFNTNKNKRKNIIKSNDKDNNQNKINNNTKSKNKSKKNVNNYYKKSNSVSKNSKSILSFDKSYLEKYFTKFYPAELIIKWLGRNNINYLKYREFVFVLSNGKYIRYQSFKSLNAFKNKIKELLPYKIDIGATYNIEPKKHSPKNLQKYKAQERELVFDIDITDYNYRFCCKGKKICQKCWKFLIIAAKILERILKEDFGYEKIFYTFSGGRGIHCWVNDLVAKTLNDDRRTAILNYIKYIAVDDIGYEIRKKVFSIPVHPSYLSAVSVAKNYFFEVLNEQKILENDKGKELLLKIIKLYFGIFDNTRIERILKNNKKSSSEKFKEVEKELKNCQEILELNLDTNTFNTEACVNEFILSLLYPKLDANVTTQTSHLLKSPFSIHENTGHVAVPMSMELLENFSFENIPNIKNIIEGDVNNLERFNEYVSFFENFIENL